MPIKVTTYIRELYNDGLITYFDPATGRPVTPPNNTQYFGDVIALQVSEKGLNGNDPECKRQLVQLYKLHMQYPFGIYDSTEILGDESRRVSVLNQFPVMRVTKNYFPDLPVFL